MKITSGLIIGILKKYFKQKKLNQAQFLRMIISKVFNKFIPPLDGSSFKITDDDDNTYSLQIQHIPSKATISRALRGGSLSSILKETDFLDIESTYAKDCITCYANMEKHVLSQILPEDIPSIITQILSLLIDDESIDINTEYKIGNNAFFTQKELKHNKIPNNINSVIFLTHLLAIFIRNKNETNDLDMNKDIVINPIFNTFTLSMNDYNLILNSLKSTEKISNSIKHSYSYSDICNRKYVLKTKEIESISSDNLNLFQQQLYYGVNKIYIHGDIATGKTIFLTNYFLNILSKYPYSNDLPFFIDLRYYDRNYDTFLSFIKQQLQSLSPTLDVPHFIDSIIEGNCTFIIDSLDAACTTNIKTRLLQFIDKFPNHTYIISGREKSFSNFYTLNLESSTQVNSLYKLYKHETTNNPLKAWYIFDFICTKYEILFKPNLIKRNYKTGLNTKELINMISLLFTILYIETPKNENLKIDYIRIDNFLSSKYLTEYKNKLNTDDFIFDISINIPAIKNNKISSFCPYKMLIAKHLLSLDSSSNLAIRLIQRIDRNKDYCILKYAQIFDPYNFEIFIKPQVLSIHPIDRREILKQLNIVFHIIEINNDLECFSVSNNSDINLITLFSTTTNMEISSLLKKLFNENKEFKAELLLNNNSASANNQNYIIKTHNQSLLIMNKLLEYYHANNINIEHIIQIIFAPNSQQNENPFKKIENDINNGLINNKELI